MPRSLRLPLVVLCWLLAALPAAAAEIDDLIRQLAVGGFGERAEAVERLATLGDSRAVAALAALETGDLYVNTADGAVVIARGRGDTLTLIHPLDGSEIGTAPAAGLDKIRVNNRVRRSLQAALGALTLFSTDQRIRREAAEAVFKSRDAGALEAVEQAIGKETVAGVRQALEQARAAILLARGSGDDATLVEAVGTIAARGDIDALSLLRQIADGPGGAAAEAADAALADVERLQALRGALQNVAYGISLGSVLLLAAIGLAITFGVMGVINMAHGEMVMLGAYTTFVVQDLMRAYAPDLLTLALPIALPLAFLVSGAVGVGIERGVIRFLYGRPLETLLATWGISLILQQVVRSVFGPTNREVSNPEWMSGATEVMGVVLTYNRLWIVALALVVFVMLILLLRFTAIGLEMRAVTQNRPMADAMGIRTHRVDALTFGLGSGIAGVAGVALSQIDNVSPNLGQSYIIDSFMVVVFGGVGNLWGTLVGALTLGVANKFLEPYAGAVLGKILLLVFIILFIQRRPRGLFALRGRSVEA